MPHDYSIIRKLQAVDVALHREIETEQIRHVTDEYTEERVATLLAKMAAAKRFWPVTEWRINV